MANDLFERMRTLPDEHCAKLESQHKFFEVLLHQLPHKLQNGLWEILLPDYAPNHAKNWRDFPKKKEEERQPEASSLLFRLSNAKNNREVHKLPGSMREEWCLLWLEDCAAQAQRSLDACWQMLKDLGLSSYVRFAYFAECYRESQNCIERELCGALRIIVQQQREYPKSLFALRRAPRVLFWLGHLPDFPLPSTAIIGSRNADNWGIHHSRQEAVLLTNGPKATQGKNQSSHWIISGLAQGCDYAAHNGALDAAGRTLAVLPSGFDRIYPKRHQNLAQRITGEGGALVSEYAPQAAALKWRCIQRDRIQAALAGQILLIQSSLEGGSMHTVRAALQMKKPVYVLDGSESCAQIRGVPLLQPDARLMGANRALLAKNLASLWRERRK